MPPSSERSERASAASELAERSTAWEIERRAVRWGISGDVVEKMKRLKLRAARVIYATRAPCKRASRSHAKTGFLGGPWGLIFGWFFVVFSSSVSGRVFAHLLMSFWSLFDAFSHLFSDETPVDVLLVFLRSFRTILIVLIVENEHLVYTRRSFSQNHLFPFGSFFRWKNKLQIKGKQLENGVKHQLK